MNIKFELPDDDKRQPPDKRKWSDILWLLSMLFLILSIVDKDRDTLWFGLTFTLYASSGFLIKRPDVDNICAIGMAGALLIAVWGFTLAQISIPYLNMKTVELFCYILADIAIIRHMVHVQIKRS